MDQDLTDHEHHPDAAAEAAGDGDRGHDDGAGVDLNERVSRLHDATEAHLNRLRRG